jgi:predicted nucleotidyltransferase
MRLSREQTLSIRHAVSALAGTDAEVFLFGSRLDDAARGGDVDLFVETDTRLSLLDRARIKMELENLLGLPVDIVAHTRGESSTPFQNIAQAGAARLGGDV